MVFLVIVGEFILYLCFAILFGAFLLEFFPKNKKPEIDVSKKVLVLSALIIPIVSFGPIVTTSLLFSEGYGFWITFKSVLLTFQIGKSWQLLTLLSVILLTFIVPRGPGRFYTVPLFLITFIMILVYTQASHAASIADWQGYVAHTSHFLAVIVWAGILGVVSWFSKAVGDWGAFLKWFSPLALICLGVVLVAGFYTMGFDIDSYDDPHAGVVTEYKNSWMLNYGQALLLKHLFIIPMLVLAAMNHFFIARQYFNGKNVNPLKWTKIESFYVLIIFAITAFMGQQFPPHQLIGSIQTYGPSLLFDLIYPREVDPRMYVTLDFSMYSYSLLALSLLFLLLMIFAILRKRATSAIAASCLSIFSLYIGLMLSIQ